MILMSLIRWLSPQPPTGHNSEPAYSENADRRAGTAAYGSLVFPHAGSRAMQLMRARRTPHAGTQRHLHVAYKICWFQAVAGASGIALAMLPIRIAAI